MDNTNFNFGEDLKNRTKKFAVKIISFTKDLDKSTENYVFTKQIIRSASSVASNYRAACRGRSKAEFYAKLSIVIEEADETLFWLEMIEEFNDKQKLKIIELFNEGEELLKIFSKSRKTMNASK
ncbi:MAG: four helix bundle protein [Chitinophagales bacterium]|nr:four helix bundle protein [Chitinophagales bacterium]